MANIKITALGGLGENGKNMYLVETVDHIFILDGGLKYPDIDMYGIDAVVPDLTYLLEHREKIAGIFVSHGHEDNIGAIPYLLRNLPINVYGTHFTISLIENSLLENKMDIKKYRLYRINENKVLTFKDTIVKFFNTSHSIPESVGISIHTSDGVIVYATDFNFMPTMETRYSTSFGRLTDLSKENVLALLTESVGTSAIGRISNDVLLEHNFNNVLTYSKGRIVVAAYSSDLIRIQKIIDLAIDSNRKIAFVGHKGEKVVKTAILNNYLRFPHDSYVELSPYSEDNLSNDKMDDLVVIVHGQREEVYRMLIKMALGDDKYIHLSNDDCLILICPPISGTERIVNDVINTLHRYNIDLMIYDRDILRSSHASRDDLKLIYSLIKPNYIIPIKGEYRHMYEQMMIATSSGYKRENIILLDNGEIAEFVDGTYNGSEQCKVGDVFVDGSLIGDVNEAVIKDRESLSNEGAVIISIYYDIRQRKVVREPSVTTKGFSTDLSTGELAGRIITLSKSIFENSLWKKNYSLSQTEQTISDEVTKLIYRITRHRPLTMIVSIDTNNLTISNNDDESNTVSIKKETKKKKARKQNDNEIVTPSVVNNDEINREKKKRRYQGSVTHKSTTK